MSVDLPSKGVIRAIFRRQQELFEKTNFDCDETRLGAALAWPRLMVTTQSTNDVFDVAVSLLIGIASEKPFPEGNKRIAFTLAALTLRRNGWILDITNEDVLRLMSALTLENITEEKAADYLRRKSISNK